MQSFSTENLQMSFPCTFVVSPTTKREQPENNNRERVFDAVYVNVY